MPVNKLFIPLALFFGLLTFFSAWDNLYDDQQLLENITLVEKRMVHVAEINSVITQLQKEQVLTAVYTARADKDVLSALSQQRRQTTAALEAPFTAECIAEIVKKRVALLHTIKLDRPDAAAVLSSYNDMILHLLQASENLIFETRDPEIKNLLIVFHLLINARDAVDQLRTRVATAFASRHLDIANARDIIALDAIYHKLIHKSIKHVSPTFQTLLNELLSQPSTHRTFQTVAQLDSRTVEDPTMTPLQWLTLSADTSEGLNDLNKAYLSSLGSAIAASKKKAKNNLMQHLWFWIGGVTSLLFLVILAAKYARELAHRQQLFEDYHKAIDHSTIVSKADQHGIITYANKAFCHVSGYSEDELLNQPHKLVRHPDMPSEVFKTMWKDIQEGKIWQGIIKNLKKDGTPYWVDATISPIYDRNGKLVEYVAIRRDITDIILLNEEIKATQSELIYLMGEAIESRSKENGHHVQRVAHYSKLLAQLAGLEDEECEIIFFASTMHDVGKLSIPDAILLKRDALNDEEWTVMKTHAETGYKILGSSNRPLLKMAATVAYEHHEHYDGNGYPRGIKGEAISIYGRIVAIADVFDALATDRIYKDAWSLQAIVQHLKEQSGKQFDPYLIELLLKHLDQFLETKNRFKDGLKSLAQVRL